MNEENKQKPTDSKNTPSGWSRISQKDDANTENDQLENSGDDEENKASGKRKFFRFYVISLVIFILLVYISANVWGGFWIFGIMIFPATMGIYWNFFCKNIGVDSEQKAKIQGWALGIGLIIFMAILYSTSSLFDAEKGREQARQDKAEWEMKKKALDFYRAFEE